MDDLLASELDPDVCKDILDKLGYRILTADEYANIGIAAVTKTTTDFSERALVPFLLLALATMLVFVIRYYYGILKS